MTDLEARYSWQLHKETPFQMRASMGHIANGTPVFVYGTLAKIKKQEKKNKRTA